MYIIYNIFTKLCIQQNVHIPWNFLDKEASRFCNMYKAMMLSTYDGPQVYLTGRSIMCSTLIYFKVLISCLNWFKFFA